MIPIGLILLALVILFCVAVVVSNPVPVTLSLFGAQIPLQTPAVFFTGAATMLVTIVALWLLRVGFRRERARRKELKSLKKAAKNDAVGSASGAGTASRAGSARPGSPTAGATSGTTGSTTSTVASTTGATAPATRPAVDTASAASQQGAHPASPTTGDRPSTTAAEREALLAEVDEATRDDPSR